MTEQHVNDRAIHVAERAGERVKEPAMPNFAAAIPAADA